MSKKVDLVNIDKKPRFAVRQKNRCRLCGRARSYYRKFAMCRICFRERALNGEIPGVVKASW
jgi:small subunit ribosomal protein S14